MNLSTIEAAHHRVGYGNPQKIVLISEVIPTKHPATDWIPPQRIKLCTVYETVSSRTTFDPDVEDRMISANTFAFQ
jgi:hypothetical protein